MEVCEFRLQVGAKRQVTIPQEMMGRLGLVQGSELMVVVKGEHAALTPMISVPRSELPEELRSKFLSRRGHKESDLSLPAFLADTATRKPRRRPAPSARAARKG